MKNISSRMSTRGGKVVVEGEGGGVGGGVGSAHLDFFDLYIQTRVKGQWLKSF